MKKNTENMRNRNNNVNNIISAIRVSCDVKGIIRNSILDNEIFSAGQMKPNKFFINFNRIGKNRNRYYINKIRDKYLKNLFEKFEKGELDYISHDDGVLEFSVNSKSIREPFIDIELSNPKDALFKLLFEIDFKNDMFSSFSKHGNNIYIKFCQPDAVEPNTFNVSWDMRKEYLEWMIDYMLLGFIKSVRMCR